MDKKGKSAIIFWLATMFVLAAIIPGVAANGPGPPTKVVEFNAIAFEKALEFSVTGFAKGWQCTAYDNSLDGIIDTISCKHKKTGITFIIKKGGWPGNAVGPH